MTRRLALLLVAVMATGCLAAPEPDRSALPSPPQVGPAGEVQPRERREQRNLAVHSLDRTLRESVVRVRNTRCDGLSTGSGFFLTPDVVATNRHVVDGALWLELSTWDGRTFESSIAGVAYDADLAVVELALPVPDVQVLPTASASPGEDVVAVGFPAGGPYDLRVGQVVDEVDGSVFGEAASVLRVTSTIEPGNSGGPLVNDAGAVVGVVFAVEIATGLGLALDVDELLIRGASGRLFDLPVGC